MVSAAIVHGFEVESSEEEELDGRYRLIRPLARVSGGGAVHAAEHIFTRRPCAIKILDASATDKTRKRTRREMDALARVQGPGIVDFLDAGESKGRLYLVLELLEGRSLAGLLAARGRLGVDQALTVSIELAAALAHSHERGVVHRDVKPANVFVTAKEGICLLDFGIAKFVSNGQPMEKLTQQNAVLGTPEYMAPEALLASPDADARVDQWGLAVTLYECLTGVVPFEGEMGEVLRKIMTTAAPRIRDLRADVPLAVAAVLDRALARDPDLRFAGMDEMRDALAAAARTLNKVAIFDLHKPNDASRDVSTVADSPVSRQKSGQARRRHLRAPYVSLARVRRADGSTVDGRIEEVSESGFQFVGDRELPDGETVSIRFALPVSGRITEASAASRWSHSTRGLMAAGFEFTTLPDEARAQLRKYVAIMCAE